MVSDVTTGVRPYEGALKVNLNLKTKKVASIKRLRVVPGDLLSLP